MESPATSFCDDIKNDILGPGYFNSKDFPFLYTGGFGSVTTSMSLQIKPRCSFNFEMNLCQKYFSVPADSCNCGGVNGKQGGVIENNCYKWRVDPNLRF